MKPRDDMNCSNAEEPVDGSKFSLKSLLALPDVEGY